MANSVAGEVGRPVYITARALPLINGENPDTADICAAAEVSLGLGSSRAAQHIDRLWRLYCKQAQHRQKLCLEGFMLGGVRVTSLDKNPFQLHSMEDEMPATKLWIANIPVSIFNDKIEWPLQDKGVVIRSPLKAELA